MPTPNPDETESEFVDRCIPAVIEDGTTDDPDQAAAICHSLWQETKNADGEPLQSIEGHPRTGNSMDRKSNQTEHRSVPFTVTRNDDTGDGLTLEGYAAVFDTWTEINGWEGNFLEQVTRGAFTKTITERTPKLQFDHGAHPLVGSIPIGSISALREDDQGLFVRARLHDNWLIQPVRDAIASGAVDGMSFRFNVIKDDWNEPKGELPKRTITEVKLHEVGPVVWPAYDDTTVGVRSRQLMSMLADETVRADLARLLTFARQEDLQDVTDVEADPDVTSPPVDDEPPQALAEPEQDQNPPDDTEPLSVTRARRVYTEASELLERVNRTVARF